MKNLFFSKKNTDRMKVRIKALAQKESNIIFGGRLAEYKYYDMAPIIGKVMDLFTLAK